MGTLDPPTLYYILQILTLETTGDLDTKEEGKDMCDAVYFAKLLGEIMTSKHLCINFKNLKRKFQFI